MIPDMETGMTPPSQSNRVFGLQETFYLSRFSMGRVYASERGFPLERGRLDADTFIVFTSSLSNAAVLS